MDFRPTNLPFENEYPKLVRDRIPEKIKRDKGKEPPTRMLSDDKEFLEYLAKKLLEEGSELGYALTHGNFTEEMADVFEIITAMLEVKKLTIEDIIAVQKEKREKNGGFEKRILMLSKE